MNGSERKSVRIGATFEYPYVFPCFDEYPKRCFKLGSDLEYMHTILNGMLHKNVVWNSYPTFKQLERALETNEIDLIGNGLLLDVQHAANTEFQYTPAAYYLGIGFFAKASPAATTLNPISTFTWDLWVCLISLTLFLWWIKPLLNKKCIITSVLFNGLFLIWCFTLTIISELYGSVLTADLVTTKKVHSTYNGLSDLGDKLIGKQCRFIIFEKYVDIPDFEIIFNPQLQYEWAKKFKAAFLTNPPIVVKDQSDIYTFVRNSSCVVGLDLLSHDLSFFDHLCNIEVKIYPDDIPFMPYVYYHNLDIHTSLALDNVFSSDSFRSYPDHLVRIYNDIFPTVCEESDNRYTLTISKIYLCFAIYAAGITLSTIVHTLSFLRDWKKYRTFTCDNSECKIMSLRSNNILLTHL